MKFFIPAALISLMLCSCGTSRQASDPQSSGTSANVENTSGETSAQLSDKAPAIDAGKSEVSGNPSKRVTTLQASETK